MTDGKSYDNVAHPANILKRMGRERSSIEVEHGGSYFRFFIKSTCLLERGMYWRNSRKLRNFKFEHLFLEATSSLNSGRSMQQFNHEIAEQINQGQPHRQS